MKLSNKNQEIFVRKKNWIRKWFKFLSGKRMIRKPVFSSMQQCVHGAVYETNWPTMDSESSRLLSVITLQTYWMCFSFYAIRGWFIVKLGIWAHLIYRKNCTNQIDWQTHLSVCEVIKNLLNSSFYFQTHQQPATITMWE